MVGRRSICIIFVCVTMAFSQAFHISSMDARAIPERLNYQGYLTDTLGVPISDTLEMVASIHTQQSGGVELWSQLHREVYVERGIFHMELGPIPDTVFTGTTGGTSRWLQLEIESQVLSMRTRINAVAYAFKAFYSDTAGHALDADSATYADTAEYAYNSINDNDWVRGTPDSVLFTANYLGIARGGAGNNLHGDSAHTHVNLGTNGHTGYPVLTRMYATIGGGRGNAAHGDYSTVSGGHVNTAGAIYSYVGGGRDNTASGAWTTVCGGKFNEAIGDSGTTIGGGWYNYAQANLGAVLGGYNNIVGDATTDTAAVVVGGWQNSAYHKFNFVGGGYENSARRDFAVVAGGYADTVRSTCGGILSGYGNKAGDETADTAVVIVGGKDNTARAKYSFIGTGYSNDTYNQHAIICGGRDNVVEGDYGFIGSGDNHRIESNYSTVPGGYDCEIYGAYGFATNSGTRIQAVYSNAAAFNGQSATASGQTRVNILSKASGTFSIDHPLDPANKILNHYFVESPEMVLIYRGAALIGDNGFAEVHLPDYFDALNQKPMIQLTGVGTYEVYVAEKIEDNRFVIGGKPGTEVYWTVTGDRKDQSAEITRVLMPVEQQKEGDLRGHSLDDDCLVATKMQLDRMGMGDRFEFQTQEGRQKFEKMVSAVSEGK